MTLRTELPGVLPFATPQWPGCGGRIRSALEDFRVVEAPAYEPSGAGEHLYLWIEKRGVTTHQVAERLARALGLPLHAVGYAGLKDARAVAAQWFSLHIARDPEPRELEGEAWRVLRISRHHNKLRPGHLRGNRFEIVVRGVNGDSALEAVLEWIALHGFPNYFGPQRFGRAGDNALRGRAILLGGERMRMPITRSRLLVNAYQAELFNRLVAERLRARSDLGRLLPGDLAVLHRNGASFPVDEPGLAEAQARADAGELFASAPLFGFRVPLASGEPGRWERALLAAEGLTAEAFRKGGKRHAPKGERRPLRVLPAELSWEFSPVAALTKLTLRFTLPAGVYATSLLREVMKSECEPDADGPAAD